MIALITGHRCARLSAAKIDGGALVAIHRTSALVLQPGHLTALVGI